MGESSDGGNADGHDEAAHHEELEKVESWLDEHPHFVHDYFVRKASRQMVDSWLLSHSAPQGMVPESSSSNSSPTSPSSGAATPVRKISAHEFEKSGLLRPILNTTVDGIPTFLSLPLPGDAAPQCNSHVGRKSRQELRALDERELIFELVKDICNDLEIRSLCHKILQNVSILTDADRCSLFLVRGDKGDPTRCLVSQLFDVSCSSTMEQMQQKEEIRIPWGTGIVGYVAESRESLNIPDCYQLRRSLFPKKWGNTRYVATTGETLNIPDVLQDDRFDPAVDGGSGLCNILRYGYKNQKKCTEELVKPSKDTFTLEVLSYHATAPIEEAKALSKCIVPSTHVYRLQDLKFNDFSLDDEDMLKACLRMFMDLDLIERFRINYDVLCRWLLSVRKNYRPVTYHNWRHAFNVSQMMFACLTITKLWHIFGEVETLSLLIACLCHDLDHRGTNNSFQIKSCSPLAQLYSTSTMEHHHFDQCIMILNSEGNQILSHLSPDEYSNVVHVLEDAILATDLAVYFRRRSTFFHMVDSGKYNWKREDNRELLRAMLMTVCDIAAITKPWEIQRVVAELVASEFFQQGDIEKEQLKIQPIDMMNREKKDELPLMQVRFIDSICAPVYESFAKISDKLQPLMDGVQQNREQWLKLAEARNLCNFHDK
ncbi:Dual 3' like protein [Argiope bruennichi]|uniref:Phosphodiesterase n=1 Tax=Argiope bruennichi TaxID=94029 RepID=A0A8T0G3F8_ARGBR|nr:Dual 3' like protein [Argiope bruennichi]